MKKQHLKKCLDCNEEYYSGTWIKIDGKSFFLCSTCYFKHCLERPKETIYKVNIIEDKENKSDV